VKIGPVDAGLQRIIKNKMKKKDYQPKQNIQTDGQACQVAGNLSNTLSVQ